MNDPVREMLEDKAIQLRKPYECFLEITYHCNFHCPMCYIRMTDQQAAPYGRMRTVEEWLDMARQLREFGVFYITLTGGECTQYPDFARLYRELYRIGFRVTLMSNAADYSEELKELFRQYPPYGVTTTLYGGSNETYYRVTGDPQGLDKVMGNIRFLRSLGVPMQVNFTITRDNVRDYPLVKAICKELNLPLNPCSELSLHSWNPRFSNAAQLTLTPVERACVECCKAEDVDQALAEAAELEKLWKPEYLPIARKEERTHNFCNGSASGAAILWNGDLQTCLSMAGAPAYKPFEIGFEAAWEQLQRDEEERFVAAPVCEACYMQNDCSTHCPAMNYQRTGDFQTPDRAICQYVWFKRKYREIHPMTTE